MVDDLGFLAGARRLLGRLLVQGDCLVAKTDPPPLGMALAGVACRRGAQRINWLQDLFPEVALGLGVLKEGPLSRVLVAARNHSLVSARLNIVIGEAMGRRLLQAGVPPTRVRIIPNWADPRVMFPVDPQDNPQRQGWGLGAGDFVLGYSGNLGRAHEVETLLAAAERLRPELSRAEAGLRILFIGGGQGIAGLKAEVAVRGLPGFRFLPYQDRGGLSRSLSAADAHLVILRPEMEGLIVPSKFYGIAAVGRPILYVGDCRGELATLVRERGCGLAVPTADGAALAEAILTLKRDPAGAEAMGERARAMLLDSYTLEQAMAAWVETLESVRSAAEGSACNSIRGRAGGGLRDAL
jgi:glycosyltransferase involved in cell wall biosynthesis